MNKQSELKIEMLKIQKEQLVSKINRLQKQVIEIDEKIERIEHFIQKQKPDSTNEENS